MLKLDSLTEDGSTDNERVNRLAAQNKDLNVSVPYIYNVSFICFYKLISIIWFIKNQQDLVSSLEKKIDETEKKYEEASRLCEERLKQAVDAETKLIEAKTSMLRFYSCRSFFLQYV